MNEWGVKNHMNEEWKIIWMKHHTNEWSYEWKIIQMNEWRVKPIIILTHVVDCTSVKYAT